MKLMDGLERSAYILCGMDLPVKTAKRLEALGMVQGTALSLIFKKHSALVVSVRGTRFALGRAIAQNIIVRKVAS